MEIVTLRHSRCFENGNDDFGVEGPIHVNLNISGVDLASRVTIFNAVVFVIPK